MESVGQNAVGNNVLLCLKPEFAKVYFTNSGFWV